jgi:hypothetical protein
VLSRFFANRAFAWSHRVMAAQILSLCRLHTGLLRDLRVACRLNCLLSRRETPCRPSLGQSVRQVLSRQQCQAHAQALHARLPILKLLYGHDETSVGSALFRGRLSIATTVVGLSSFAPRRRNNFKLAKATVASRRLHSESLFRPFERNRDVSTVMHRQGFFRCLR